MKSSNLVFSKNFRPDFIVLGLKFETPAKHRINLMDRIRSIRREYKNKEQLCIEEMFRLFEINHGSDSKPSWGSKTIWAKRFITVVQINALEYRIELSGGAFLTDRNYHRLFLLCRYFERHGFKWSVLRFDSARSYWLQPDAKNCKGSICHLPFKGIEKGFWFQNGRSAVYRPILIDKESAGLNIYSQVKHKSFFIVAYNLNQKICELERRLKRIRNNEAKRRDLKSQILNHRQRYESILVVHRFEVRLLGKAACKSIGEIIKSTPSAEAAANRVACEVFLEEHQHRLVKNKKRSFSFEKFFSNLEKVRK